MIITSTYCQEGSLLNKSLAWHKVINYGKWARHITIHLPLDSTSELHVFIASSKNILCSCRSYRNFKWRSYMYLASTLVLSEPTNKNSCPHTQRRAPPLYSPGNKYTTTSLQEKIHSTTSCISLPTLNPVNTYKLHNKTWENLTETSIIMMQSRQYMYVSINT